MEVFFLMTNLAVSINEFARWVAKPVRKPWLSKLTQYPPRPLYFSKSIYDTPLQSPPLSMAIVTPAYNHAEYIRPTIESVLAQNYPLLNYIVKDGGSTDETKKILESYADSLKWLSGPDSGQTDAINIGFQHVAGEIMGWLNSDDLLTPGTLNYVSNYFQTHPEVDFIYGNRIIVNKAGDEIGRIILPPHDSKALRHGDFVPQETMFWRRRVWDKLGGLDSTVQFAMDWDFILRAQHNGFRFARLPRFLGVFRVYPEQKSQAMESIGNFESLKLRQLYTKFEYSPSDFRRGFWPYLVRQNIYQRLYMVGLLRY